VTTATATTGRSTTTLLMGVRHQGPGSARSVVRALDECSPHAVLVEFPADSAPLLRWVAAGLVPPIALLGHVADDPTTAAFWPLAAFSPEWQAFSWALRHGVELRPIDLPLAAVLAGSQAGGIDPSHEPMSDPIAELAAAAGDPEPERWWEDVVEHRGDGAPAFAAIAAAMAAVRPDPLVTVDETEAQREAHMREAIRGAHRDDFERVAVVCGAWHVPALDTTLTTSTADRQQLAGSPRVKTAMSWIPWTHERLAARTGYAAGVESPGWYAHVFAHPGPDGVGRFLVDAARHLRGAGFDVSPDHLIGATRLAGALSSMRGRPRPGLAEVLDAADTVFADHRGHGVPGGVLMRRDLVVGDALGVVPDAAPQVPLARDLAASQRRCRLGSVAAARTIELDLRTPTGLARSHLLHRGAVLGLRWARLVEGRGSSGTFRETWEVHGEPTDAVRVVEASAHGTTLVAAATSVCVERAQSASRLVELHRTLDAALLADLPDAIPPCLEALRVGGAHHPDIGQLVDTLGPLADTLRYGDVRGTDRAAVGVVFDDFVDRALAALPSELARVSGDAAPAAARRIAAMHAALALRGDDVRLRRWRDVVATLAGSPSGLVAGRASRVLHDAGWWDSDRVGRRLARALSAASDPEAGAAFVEGFLAGSGTVLLHDSELLAIVDGWLSSLRGDVFEQVIPLLRRTFGAFEPAERRRLGWSLAGNEAPTAGFGGLDPDRVVAAAQLAGRLLGLEGDR